MRETPAGDVDYERGGQCYSAVRQPEPRFANAIRQALGSVRTLINVGAGAGSYEPDDLAVTPVEPSAAMRAERPAWLAPAVDAVAEELPFPDQAFDGALASLTVHQWSSLEVGLTELRRVTSGPIVVMTFDPTSLREFWLKDYSTSLMEREARRMPELSTITDLLQGTSEVKYLSIPANCKDGFAEAFFGRPEAFLDPSVREAQSAWRFLSQEATDEAISALRRDLNDGSWDDRYGTLRRQPLYFGSLRLIINHPRTV